MTHTLHRRGSEKELQKDFVILAMAARGVNREGAAPKLARAPLLSKIDCVIEL